MPGPARGKARALGVLGSWVAAFGTGGTFTLQGDAGGFLGAANQGTTVVERMAGHFTGYRMASGSSLCSMDVMTLAQK